MYPKHLIHDFYQGIKFIGSYGEILLLYFLHAPNNKLKIK